MKLEEALRAKAGDIIATLYIVLRSYSLCARCAGRLFALLGRGLDNATRGKALKTTLLMTLHGLMREGVEEARDALERLSSSLCEIAPRLYQELGVECRTSCSLCGGRLEEFIEDIVKRAVKILREYDAETFVVGVRLSQDIRQFEEMLVSKYNLVYAESLASELKREIGKRIRSFGFEVDFANPDITLLVSYPEGAVQVTINPILLLGFYKKLARRVSQSSWITRFGVKRYPFSVQDGYIPLLELYNGVSIVIHAAGREDVDVRMLGSGRPIVVEVKEPRRRRVDVKHAEKIVNEAWPGLFETILLERVKRQVVRSIVKGVEGEERHSKIYRAVVYVPQGIDEEDLERLEEYFRNRLVKQRTPKRVRHRRADIIRERKVYSVSTKKLSDNIFIALIHAEGGLYIKELVNGEETWPGFPEVVGKDMFCIELDVLWVESRLRLKKGLGEAGEGREHGKAAQGLSS